MQFSVYKNSFLVHKEIICYNDVKYYHKYINGISIPCNIFEMIIEKMGGHVYNGHVGVVENVIFYNGVERFSVQSPISYDDCDKFVRKMFNFLKRSMDD